MAVLVGCSGWHYRDWVGAFYPLDLARREGEWLAYYARYFTTVEINSSFYRPPGEAQVSSWIRRAKAWRGFSFSLKMPKEVTHNLMVSGDAKRAIEEALSFQRRTVEPLAEAGLLGCVLIQLSPRFENDETSLSTLEAVIDALSTKRHRHAIEFRHGSWFAGGEIDGPARTLLRSRGVANVLVDGPSFPIVSEETADHSYIRFHGRNADIWHRRKEDDYRIDRYDYLYGEDQLASWVPRIREAKTKTVFVYFNNHARSKAARNAFQMMDLLGMEHREKSVRIQDQFTLGSFRHED
ncbi:MAG: DUF72 domain-containing protein [Methanotrichaceae archaeon]|nr:DUF72 domain-containing protein [Methanotrichaceae archaeon]